LKALLVSVPVGLLVVWSVVVFIRRRRLWELLQLCGAGWLVVVVFAHISEALQLFPQMAWGSPTSIGHYLDLWSALFGLTLVPIGFIGAKLTR
jgi:hypothetical protein